MERGLLLYLYYIFIIAFVGTLLLFLLLNIILLVFFLTQILSMMKLYEMLSVKVS